LLEKVETRMQIAILNKTHEKIDVVKETHAHE